MSSKVEIMVFPGGLTVECILISCYPIFEKRILTLPTARNYCKKMLKVLADFPIACFLPIPPAADWTSDKHEWLVDLIVI